MAVVVNSSSNNQYSCLTVWVTHKRDYSFLGIKYYWEDLVTWTSEMNRVSHFISESHHRILKNRHSRCCCCSFFIIMPYLLLPFPIVSRRPQNPKSYIPGISVSFHHVLLSPILSSIPKPHANKLKSSRSARSTKPIAEAISCADWKEEDENGKQKEARSLQKTPQVENAKTFKPSVLNIWGIVEEMKNASTTRMSNRLKISTVLLSRSVFPKDLYYKNNMELSRRLALTLAAFSGVINSVEPP